MNSCPSTQEIMDKIYSNDSNDEYSPHKLDFSIEISLGTSDTMSDDADDIDVKFPVSFTSSDDSYAFTTSRNVGQFILNADQIKTLSKYKKYITPLNNYHCGIYALLIDFNFIAKCILVYDIINTQNKKNLNINEHELLSEIYNKINTNCKDDETLLGTFNDKKMNIYDFCVVNGISKNCVTKHNKKQHKKIHLTRGKLFMLHQKIFVLYRHNKNYNSSNKFIENNKFIKLIPVSYMHIFLRYYGFTSSNDVYYNSNPLYKKINRLLDAKKNEILLH